MNVNQQKEEKKKKNTIYLRVRILKLKTENQLHDWLLLY